jgi:hypothetical protein
MPIIGASFDVVEAIRLLAAELEQLQTRVQTLETAGAPAEAPTRPPKARKADVPEEQK